MDTNTLATLVVLMKSMANQQPPANNSLAVVSLIMAGLGPLIAAFAAYWAAKAVRNTEDVRKEATVIKEQVVQAVKNTDEGKKETGVLKEHINHRMDELQEQTKKASFAEGAASNITTAPVIPVHVTHLERLIQELLERTPKPPSSYTAPTP